MSRLNFDTLTLVYHEVHCPHSFKYPIVTQAPAQLYSNQSLSDLRSAANVCRSWRSAATPFLFRNIQVDLSSERETQLEKWTSSPLSQDSPSRCFVRQLQVRGSQRSLLNHYLDNIINSLPSLPNLSHFSLVKARSFLQVLD